MGMDRKIEKKRWTPAKIAKIAGGVVVAGLIAMALVNSGGGRSLNVKLERVTVSEVKKDTFREYTPVIGQVMPKNTMYLDAVEGGRVEKKFVEAGTVLKKGDPILQLSNTNLLMDIMYREAELVQQSNSLRSLRLSLEQNQLNLDKDANEADYKLKTIKSKYERHKILFKEQLISKEVYEQVEEEYFFLKKRHELVAMTREKEVKSRKLQIQQLEASLKRMQENLGVVKTKLDNLLLRAPVDGYLTSLDAEIGQTKSAGERLGQIDENRGFKVRAGIDEHYIDRIEVGKTGIFEFTDKKYKLEVYKIYPEVKEGRFNVDMRFTETEPEGIRRGQTLHVRLQLSDEIRAMLLPTGGFYQKTGGNWVYILNESGTEAVKQPIKLGRYNSEVHEILEGLKPGDKVITSSYDTFGDMDRLILK